MGVNNMRARHLFASLEQDAINKLRNDGVICTCTCHSCPEIRGCTGIILHRKLNLNGQAPNFTTLPKPSPTGTVQTFPDDPFLIRLDRQGSGRRAKIPDKENRWRFDLGNRRKR